LIAAAAHPLIPVYVRQILAECMSRTSTAPDTGRRIFRWPLPVEQGGVNAVIGSPLGSDEMAGSMKIFIWPDLVRMENVGMIGAPWPWRV